MGVFLPAVLAVVLSVAAPIYAATSATCQCIGAATNCGSGANTWSTTCQNVATSNSWSVTANTCSSTSGTAAICSASGSGGCPDSNSASNLCNYNCGVTGATGSVWSCSAPSSSSCFPAHATVMLSNGTALRMDSIAVGDKVLVGNKQYSEVYMFSHRLSAVNADFVRIEATSGLEPTTLMLTANHYLYVNGRMAIASTVTVGDKLTRGDGELVQVSRVSTVAAAGLYNPHTMDGDIVVDGVLTSTYTSDINPSLAHAALWPVRMLHTLGHRDVVGNAFADGSDMLAAVLPDGKPRY